MIPENISFAEAAAATQSPLTAWQALIDTGHICKGERVLIHGGAGGVGNYAIQIAKQVGCYVITTVGENDREFAKRLGADEIIDYKIQQFEQEIRDVDFILDTIGGDNFARSLKVLAPKGRIVLLPSDKKEEADKMAAQQGVNNYKHILMHSSGEEMQVIAQMIQEGKINIYIDKVYPFERLREAQEQLEHGKVRGKIVVLI